MCTAVGKHGGGVVADAGVGAGDHNDAPALIGRAPGRPFTVLLSLAVMAEHTKFGHRRAEDRVGTVTVVAASGSEDNL